LANAISSPRFLAGNDGMDQQHVGHRADQRDRAEVLHGVEAGVLVQRRIDGLAAADGHQQRVAVLGSLGRQLGADVAAGARAVVHHHRGLQDLGQLLADDAADDVVGAAGRLRHDHRDGPGRECLRGRQQGCRQRGGEQSATRATESGSVQGDVSLVAAIVSWRRANDKPWQRGTTRRPLAAPSDTPSTAVRV
jgi:hypothetical protein